MGALVGGTVALAVVLNVKTIGATAAGLMLVYSLDFTDTLIFFARAHADVSFPCLSPSCLYFCLFTVIMIINYNMYCVLV